MDLHVPLRNMVHSEGDLTKALIRLSPRIVIYMMSFLTLGIFWGRTATPAQFPRKVSPKPGLDPPALLVRCDPHAFFDTTSGRLSRHPGRPAFLLDEYLPAGSCTLSELELRYKTGTSERGYGSGSPGRDQAADPVRSGTLCFGCFFVFIQHASCHRVHLCRSAVLCYRTPVWKKLLNPKGFSLPDVSSPEPGKDGASSLDNPPDPRKTGFRKMRRWRSSASSKGPGPPPLKSAPSSTHKD